MEFSRSSLRFKSNLHIFNTGYYCSGIICFNLRWLWPFFHGFRTNRFIHIMSIDFIVVSWLFPFLIPDDLKRRKMITNHEFQVYFPLWFLPYNSFNYNKSTDVATECGARIYTYVYSFWSLKLKEARWFRFTNISTCNTFAQNIYAQRLHPNSRHHGTITLILVTVHTLTLTLPCAEMSYHR
jgi:hypothetical protein